MRSFFFKTHCRPSFHFKRELRYNLIKMDEISQIKELCAHCFDTLLSKLLNKSDESLKFPNQFSGKSFPLFVTWYKNQSGTQELRGCIGTFKPDLLDELVGKYALISAFDDYRFRGISLKEVPLLSCSVSLLTDFEDAKDPFDWEIGKHGIQIRFGVNGNNNYGGTFLPEVAKEQNWDHRTTLAYLVQKAGYSGNLDNVIGNIRTTRYQSRKVCISFDEYKGMRKDCLLLNFSV